MNQTPRDPLLLGAQATLPIEHKRRAAETNRSIIDANAKRDFLGNPPDPENSIGLAMSGGGIRSAFVNIGVMKSLHEAGLLQRFDYISSVSGGSYAMSWYIDQVVAPENNIKQPQREHPLSPLGFQHALRSFERNGATNPTLGYVTQLGLYLKSISLGIAFSEFRKQGGAADSYVENLDKTFLRGFATSENSDYDQLELTRLRSIDRPLFIYNTTISNSNSKSPVDSIFEFNQRNAGNEALGYHDLQAATSPGPCRNEGALKDRSECTT